MILLWARAAWPTYVVGRLLILAHQILSISFHFTQNRQPPISARWYSARTSTADRCAVKVGAYETLLSPSDGHTRDLPFSKRGNPGSCAPRLNTESESAYWIYAPSTSPGILGDVVGSSMLSSQILHVSAALSPKGTRERSSNRSDTV